MNCIFCEQKVETNEHLFLCCPLMKGIFFPPLDNSDLKILQIILWVNGLETC